MLERKQSKLSLTVKRNVKFATFFFSYQFSNVYLIIIPQGKKKRNITENYYRLYK